MAIKSGIGFGAAQVFNTADKIVNTYANTIRAQQAKRQKEQEKYLAELADFAEMSSRKGVRPVDEPLLTNTWESIKKLNEKAASITNPVQRKRALSEIEKAVTNYRGLVDRSVQENSDIYSFSTSHADKTELLDPGFRDMIAQRASTTIDKLPNRFNPLEVRFKPNPIEREKIQKELQSELEPLSMYDKALDRPLGGGKRQAYKKVKPEDALLAITAKLNQRPTFRKLAYAQFVEENPGVTPTDELVAKNEYKIIAPKGMITYEANVYDPTEGTKKDDATAGLSEIAIRAYRGDAAAAEGLKSLSGGKIVDYQISDGRLSSITPMRTIIKNGYPIKVVGNPVPIKSGNDLVGLITELGISKSNVELLKRVQGATRKPSGNTTPPKDKSKKPVGKSR